MFKMNSSSIALGTSCACEACTGGLEVAGRHRYSVVRAKIEDATGKCPGVSWSAVLRGRTAIDYNKTLAKVLAARNAELVRRGLGKLTEEPN
jgi:hypothetical protein